MVNLVESSLQHQQDSPKTMSYHNIKYVKILQRRIVGSYYISMGNTCELSCYVICAARHLPIIYITLIDYCLELEKPKLI